MQFGQCRIKSAVHNLEVEVKKGTPQGSVISPVLFKILINGIFSTVSKDLGLSLFADDGAIWRRGRKESHSHFQYNARKPG